MIEKVDMPLNLSRRSHRLTRQAKKPARAVLPFYFYAAGVLAAIAAAAILVSAEVQGKTPTALNVADLGLLDISVQ